MRNAGAVSLWWPILIDPQSRSRDAAFPAAVEQAITLTDAWTRREPERALVARYRFARALLAAGRRAELEQVVAARPPAPPIARAGALVDLAALIESAGERERARDLFQRAADRVGGAPEARAVARRAPASLAA